MGALGSAMERGLLKSGRLISTTLITGAALGVLCVFGYRHLSTSPVVELGRNPVSREVHDDATVDDSYYAVQMAKLYRERDDSFGSEMIQTLAAVACSIVWDVVVVWHHLTEHAHPKFRLRAGCTLQARAGYFHGIHDMLLTITGADGVTLAGEAGGGALLRMNKPQYLVNRCAQAFNYPPF